MPPNGSSATAASGTPASTRWKSGSMAEPLPDRRLGFTMTRVFAAPRGRVWREWTEPEAFADWFGGAEAEVPLDTVAMDVRPGGAWHATMLHGGREIRWKGEYVEVQRPERLVLTFSDQPDDAPHQLVVVMLRELGGGRTEMGVGQPGSPPPGAHGAARHGRGGGVRRAARQPPARRLRRGAQRRGRVLRRAGGAAGRGGLNGGHSGALAAQHEPVGAERELEVQPRGGVAAQPAGQLVDLGEPVA